MHVIAAMIEGTTEALCFLLVSMLALILVFLVTRIHRRHPFRVWSPVYMALISYVVLGFGGLLLFGFTEAARGTFYGLPLSRSVLVWTLVQILILLCVMCLGSLAYLGAIRPRRSFGSRPGSAPTPKHPQESQGLELKAASLLLVVVVAAVPFIALLVGAGVSNVWSRSIYFVDAHHMMKIIGYSLGMVAVFASGLIFAFGVRPQYRPFRILGLGIFAAYELVFFALATRQFAVAPVLFFLGALLVNPRSKWLQAFAALSVIASLLLIQVPLSLRGLSHQGLAPFLAYMTTSWRGLAGEALNPEQLQAFFLNTLYGFPLTAYVSSAPQLPPSYFLTSVNPLPGLLTSWYQINMLLRVNVYIPYNSLGELLNYGLLVAAAMFFLLGIVLTAVDTWIRLSLAQHRYFLPVLYVGLSALFILNSTQYNLRSSMRIIYYMIAVAFMARMFHELNPARRNS